MAYVLPEDDEDEKPGQAQSPAAGGMASPLGGGTLGAVGGGPASSPVQKTSTDFVSWDRILNANKDAATASADKLAGRVGGAAQAVQDRGNAAGAAFTGAVKEGTPVGLQVAGARVVPPKPSAAPATPSVNVFGQPTATPAITPPTPAPGATGAPTEAPRTKPPAPAPTGNVAAFTDVATPEVTPVRPPTRGGIQQDGETKGQLEARAGATYKGPESLAEFDKGWGDILTDGREAASQVGLTNQRDANGNLRGDAGIETLLREGAQGPYTQGQSRMDAALLGSQGRGRFNQLQKDWGGLLGGLKGIEGQAGANVADAKQRIGEDAASARAELGNLSNTLPGTPAKPTVKTHEQLTQEMEGLDRDSETDDWLNSIYEKAQGWNLDGPLGGIFGDANHNAVNYLQEGQKTGDWTKWAKWLNDTRGEGAFAEWKNAYDDTKNRQKRRAQWEVDAADAGWQRGDMKLSWAEQQAWKAVLSAMEQGGNGGYSAPAQIKDQRGLYQSKKYRT